MTAPTPTMTKLLALASRFEVAAPDDYGLWREANDAVHATLAQFPIKTANEAIISLAQRLNRPDLLIAVALSWVPEEWTLGCLCESDNKKGFCELRQGYLTSYDKVVMSETATGKEPSCLWNALASAALRALGQTEERK